MPWPFKREESDPTEAFAERLFATHENWEARIDSASHDQTRAVLLSGAAGATVAFGAHAAMLTEEVGGAAQTGGRSSDRVVRFVNALEDPRAIEAAYRVITWALVSEYTAHFSPADHEHEIGKCEIVFGFQNLYEETAVAYGQPASPEATEDEQEGRMYILLKASLYGMISAALDEPVEPEDDSINSHLNEWIDQFEAGIDAGAERLEELL